MISSEQKFKIAAYVYPKALQMPTGISMLTLNMVKALANNSSVELCLLASENELTATGDMPSDLKLEGIPVIPLPFKRSTREALWLGASFPSIDRYIPLDYWVYSSMETYIPSGRCKRIVTVHHLEQNQPFSLSHGLRLRQRTAGWRLRKAIETADLIVAQSTFTCNQINERYGIPVKQISVVGSGVDESLFNSPHEPIDTVQKYTPYVISAGAFQSRKGTDFLFSLARELSARKSPLKIVCPFGLRGLLPYTEEVKSLPNVVALDYITRNELLELIRSAVCMVIPSRLEGFGLTAIESMALGTPVVASNSSALPETLGGAGILINPEDTLLMTDAVEKLFWEPNYRDRLVTLGLIRAENYTWSKCMERLLKGIAKTRGDVAEALT